MDELEGSLSDQHVEIERVLAAVVAAGRAARWPEYRRHFGTLRECVRQHMVLEEEGLFPLLEMDAAAAVRALRDEHAQLRRHLEILGAAAPEQDPEGCIAELEALAELLRSHHAAEMALDPHYAIRPAPRLATGDPPPMDLRGLQPPEPLVRIFQALERNPGTALRVILPHEPLPLYALLRERGFSHTGAPRPDGGFEVLIEPA
jgi:hypothetical protein